MATDPEGGVYVTGSDPFGPTGDTGRSVAMVLERSDPDGEQVWIRRWRSPDELFTDAVGFDVAIAPDGSLIYVAGEVMIPPGEARRVRLWAYSPEGTLLWSSEASGSALGSTAAASSTGVVAGGAGWLGAWGADGSPSWVQSFEEPAGEHCDGVADLAVGDRGEIYAVGYLDTTPTCGQMEGGAHEDADIVIQRRSAAGELLWSQVLTDAGTDNDRAVAVDVTGRWVFVAGEMDGRAWLARLSPDGQIAWTRRWGKTEFELRVVDVSAASWGPVYVIADRRCAQPGDCGTLSLRRFAPDGELEWGWSQRLRGYPVASSVATAVGETVYVTASDFSARGILWRMLP